MKTKQKLCRCCGCYLAVWQPRNQTWHGFNLLLTLLTCGLWGIFWVPSMLIFREGAWVCSRCGRNV